MKKKLTIWLMGLLASLLVAVPVLAAYTASILVTEFNPVSTNNYTMYPAYTAMDADFMATEGFMSATGLDTRVGVGTTYVPHMLADDRLLFATPVVEGGNYNFAFTTENAALTDFYTIVGYDGYVTIPDAAAIELANNFEVEIDGYTYISVGGDFLVKDGAFRIYSDGGTDITAAILSGAFAWADPTGFVDPDGQWNNEANAFDNNTATFAEDVNVPQDSWSSYLELTRAAVTSSSLRVYLSVDSNPTEIMAIEVDVFYTAAWHNVYQGPHTNLAWVTYNIPDGPQGVTAMRVRCYSTGSGRDFRVNEVDFGQDPTETVSVTAAAVGDGEHVVTVYADTVNLYIDIDTVNQDTQALAGASVPANANDYIYMDNNLSYVDIFTIDVAGAEVLRYEPTTYIIADTLLDETGTNDGAITWGDNLGNITVTIGSLIPPETPFVGVDVVAPDIAGEITDPADMYPADAAMANPGTIFDSLFSDMATLASDTPLVLVWWFIYGLFAVLSVAIAYKATHHLAISGFAQIAVTGAFIAAGVIPFWFIIMSVVAAIALMTAERVPSV